MKKLLSLILAGSLLLSMAACASKQTDVIRVVLDWTPNTNHTGLYAAQELGYYRDAGLTVEIIQPPEDGGLALVGGGKAEFAVGFQESLGPALALDAAPPVTAVAALLSHNTSGIVSRKEDGITSPKELEGKRFACWSSPFADAIMTQVISADGGDLSNVNILPNTVTDVVSALSANVDAVWIYAGWDGIAVQLADLDVNYFAFADLDPVFDYYTPILVANNDFLSASPDKAKAFLAATSQGYQYAIQYPDKAGELLLNAAPELSPELVQASQEYLADQYQADAPRWGEIDPARWSRFYGWMFDQGLLERDIRDEGFTNDYLPE